jgi:hypothetical protein
MTPPKPGPTWAELPSNPGPIGNDGTTTWADVPCGCRWWHDSDLRTDDGPPDYGINYCPTHAAAEEMADFIRRWLAFAESGTYPGTNEARALLARLGERP